MNKPAIRPASKTEVQLRDILSRRIMFLDGAMGTIIQQYKLDETAYRGGPTGRFIDFAAPADSGARELFVKGNNELLTLTQPHVIQEIHEAFLAVGCDAVETNTFGATSIACVDSSKLALDSALVNAEINGAALEVHQGEALDVLKRLRGEGRLYDLVIVDPPALIKRKRDTDAGTEHYAALNRQAIQLLAPNGILIACSCSFHMDASELQRILLRESRAAGRRLQILEQGGQSPDHPVHPAIPETRYLKSFVCRLS